MQIIPITELRNTSKIDEMCSMNKEPIYITKNGYGAMVVMNLKAYEEEQEEKLLLRRLLNVKNGNILDGDEELEKLRKKYEL